MDQVRANVVPGWNWDPMAPVLDTNHTSGTAIDMNHGCTLTVDRSLRARFRNWIILWRYRLNFRAHIARRIIDRMNRIIFRLERWT